MSGAEVPGRGSLERTGKCRQAYGGWSFKQDMNVVPIRIDLQDCTALLREERFRILDQVRFQSVHDYRPAVFCDKDKVVLKQVTAVGTNVIRLA